LQPQALDRLGRLGVLHDVAKDEFAFAAGVAGIDELDNVLAANQPQQEIQPRGGLFQRPQGEFGRNRRQVSECPLTAFDLLLLGHTDFQQVADRGGEHVAIAFKVVIVTREPAQCARNVCRDRGFLGNDQVLGHRVVKVLGSRPKARG
jgi:hypothetical protein